ncbi:MAG: SPFH/Band 7/PHB domain protein [Candidatus Wallbacteria bacterium]|nr:SPFH/Band 7/PHB domain protein [Candidatus Wallbacteria bacterium]
MLILASGGGVVLTFLAIMAVILGFKGIVLVRQAQVILIERLGKYHRTLDSGLHFIWPFIDQARTIVWRYVEQDMLTKRHVVRIREVAIIDLRETVYDFPRQNVITKDNVTIDINALLYFQVTDPVKAVYEIANLPEAIEKLTQTTLRNVIGELDLDQTLISREVVNHKLRAILDEATDKWGVKINRVELQDINPPDDIKTAMEKQMRAERDKRANILDAEGYKQAAILKAQGVRDAAVAEAEGERQKCILEAQGRSDALRLMAEGEAKAIEIIKNAVGQENNPVSYLVAIKYIEAFTKISTEGTNKTIFMPYEASSVLSSVGMMKAVFDKEITKPAVTAEKK